MEDDLKQALVNRLKQVGAYDVRIADPRVGYEYAKPISSHPLDRRLTKHPLELWEECRSVVVFALACPPENNNTYLGPYAPWKETNRRVGPTPRDIQSEDYAMDRLFRLFTASITLKGMTFLQRNGYTVSLKYCSNAMPGLKLSAYEAGLGVYGRAGFLIHPVLGSRMRLGGILTDAVLTPDGRLERFDPCANCDLCLTVCPAKAHDQTKRYPHSFDRKKCITKRGEIADKGFYCHNCYAVCPAGKLKDDELLRIKEAKSFYKPHRSRALTIL